MTIDGLRRSTPQPILADFLAFESGWKSDATGYLSKALAREPAVRGALNTIRP
jgi:hypothetical protein